VSNASAEAAFFIISNEQTKMTANRTIQIKIVTFMKLHHHPPKKRNYHPDFFIARLGPILF